jgi:hypothetical protein
VSQNIPTKALQNSVCCPWELNQQTGQYSVWCRTWMCLLVQKGGEGEVFYRTRRWGDPLFAGFGHQCGCVLSELSLQSLVRRSEGAWNTNCSLWGRRIKADENKSWDERVTFCGLGMRRKGNNAPNDPEYSSWCRR